MEIVLQYPDFHGLQRNISILFRTDLVCRLNLSLDGIRLAVEFFVSNWNILKIHSSPVIVGTCLLSAGYLTHTSTKKTRKVLMDVFHISLSSMKSCLYDMLKKNDVSPRYELHDPEKLLLENYERIDSSQCQSWRHYRDISP